MSIEIERALLSDLQRLNEISFEAKSHWDYPQEWLDLWKEDLKLTPEEFPERSVFKLVSDGSTIGFCAILESETEYEVEHLWVLPQSIGLGLGKKLLEYCLAETILKDKPVIVASDPNAEGFYRKQGFETFAQRESVPAGRTLPLMKKK